MNSQLFQMHEFLEYVMVDVLDAVAVEVQVLEPAQPVEGTGSQCPQLVVVEQQ